MDDLEQLQSRVEAARERLGGAEADQRKYGLRLDDLVRIVEGALSRQSEELKAARIRSASLQTELDDAGNTISRQELELAGKETDIARLESQNEQLRAMVKTLLDLVEGRNATPMREAMIRLERGVRHLLSENGSNGAKPAPEAEAPVAPPAPARPVLVQQQGPIAMTPRLAPRPSEPEAETEAGETGEALVELTSLGRDDPEEFVKEPPMPQMIRRLSDA